MKKTVEIDLSKNATYYVKDGELKTVRSPDSGYGKQTITWENGKPHHKQTLDSDFC